MPKHHRGPTRRFPEKKEAVQHPSSKKKSLPFALYFIFFYFSLAPRWGGGEVRAPTAAVPHKFGALIAKGKEEEVVVVPASSSSSDLWLERCPNCNLPLSTPLPELLHIEFHIPVICFYKNLMDERTRMHRVKQCFTFMSHFIVKTRRKFNILR